MTLRQRFVPLAFIACFFAASAQAAEPDRAAAARALHALFDEAWERDLREDPTLASALGDHRYDHLWPDVSREAIERRHREDGEILARLQRIDRSLLSSEDQLSYDLFAQRYRNRIALHPFRPEVYEQRARDGVHTLAELAEVLPFAAVRDFENWIARLRSLDRFLEQQIALLETGIREKRTQPRVIMERVVPVLDEIAAGPAEKSPFYAPFTRMPESIPEAERTRLAAEGKAAVEQVVLPAYRRFTKFFREKLLPATRESVGIWDTPDGEAYYRELVSIYTTTRLTPDEIHEIGLKEVARIRAEMDAVMRETGFTGTFAEFLEFLRTDPRFYFETPEELFREYVVTAKRIEPELVKLFGRLPRTPYGVRPIPMTSAPNTTTAYYMPPAADGTRAGFYYVNLYRPEVRPKYEIEVLTVHEAVPGHHLQIALAQEQKGLPLFRRNARFTAFVEGWGLYAESLGPELGLYRDPYSKFGQLTYDMWRAVRLVVDTGMHHKRWTREQAIEYFKANAAKTEADIVNEIDRYIAWPGQALAYKIGQLEILKLRREAQQALGSRFDIRDFHDVVLANGALPLDVLERIVREWVERCRSSEERCALESAHDDGASSAASP